jgi:hypothetical protein
VRPAQQFAEVVHAPPVVEHVLLFWHSLVGGTLMVEVTLHDRVGDAPVAKQQSSSLTHG